MNSGRRKRSVIQSAYLILNSGALLIIADIVMRRHNIDGRNSLRVTFAYVTYANAVFGGNTEWHQPFITERSLPTKSI